MIKQPTVLAGVVFGLFMVLILLPILTGGPGSAAFPVLFTLLVISLAVALVFALLNRRQQR